MRTTYAVCTTVGRVRKENQDNFYLNGITKPVHVQEIALEGTSEEKYQLFAVCDGMGGETDGEIAAYVAVEFLKKNPAETFSDEWQNYLLDVNDAICDYQENNECSTGTTFAGVHINDDKLQAINLGDSRIYYIQDNKMIQLSKDHTEFQELVDAGVLKPEDFSNSVTHNYLTQSLGVDLEEELLEPYVSKQISMADGDMILICSDGLYGTVSNDEMTEILSGNESIALKSQKLVDLAEKNGSTDNITALIIRISNPQ